MFGLQEDETQNIGDFLLPTCLVSEGSCIAQRPSFWIEFGTRLGKALLPLAWRYFEKDAAGGGSCMASGGEAGAGRGVVEETMAAKF